MHQNSLKNKCATVIRLCQKRRPQSYISAKREKSKRLKTDLRQTIAMPEFEASLFLTTPFCPRPTIFEFGCLHFANELPGSPQHTIRENTTVSRPHFHNNIL
jgi:hypothetical protein